YSPRCGCWRDSPYPHASRSSESWRGYIPSLLSQNRSAHHPKDARRCFLFPFPFIGRVLEFHPNVPTTKRTSKRLGCTSNGDNPYHLLLRVGRASRLSSVRLLAVSPVAQPQQTGGAFGQTPTFQCMNRSSGRAGRPSHSE